MVSELLSLKNIIIIIIDTVVICYYLCVICLWDSRHTYHTLLMCIGHRTTLRSQSSPFTWLIRVLWLLLVGWPRSFQVKFMSLLLISQWESSDERSCFSKWDLGLKLKSSSLCKECFNLMCHLSGHWNILQVLWFSF